MNPNVMFREIHARLDKLEAAVEKISKPPVEKISRPSIDTKYRPPKDYAAPTEGQAPKKKRTKKRPEVTPGVF